MPASNSDGLLANPAFMRAVEAARAQAEQLKAQAGGLLAAVGSGLGSSRVCAVLTGGNSLAGWREAARSALLEPTVHGEAVRR